MKVALAFALLSFAYATPERSVLEYFPVFNAAKADIDELKQLMTDLKAEVADLRAENQRFRDELNSNYTGIYMNKNKYLIMIHVYENLYVFFCIVKCFST